MPFRDGKQKACTTINSGPGKTRNDFPHIKQNLNENWTPNSVLPLPSSLSTLFHFFFFSLLSLLFLYQKTSFSGMGQMEASLSFMSHWGQVLVSRCPGGGFYTANTFYSKETILNHKLTNHIQSVDTISLPKNFFFLFFLCFGDLNSFWLSEEASELTVVCLESSQWMQGLQSYLVLVLNPSSHT